MFDIERRKDLKTERFIESFKEYCDWCWGNDYGDCSVCRQQYEEELSRRSKNNER